MKHAKAKKLLKMIVVYLEKARFPVVIDFDAGGLLLEVSDVAHTCLQLPVGFVTLGGETSSLDEYFPIKVKRDIVVSKDFLNGSVSREAVKKFWLQFLEMIPKKVTVFLTYPTSLRESMVLRDWDTNFGNFNAFYRECGLRVRVKIGRIECDCSNYVYFKDLIPLEKMREMWEKCVAPLESEPKK